MDDSVSQQPAQSSQTTQPQHAASRVMTPPAHKPVTPTPSQSEPAPQAAQPTVQANDTQEEVSSRNPEQGPIPVAAPIEVPDVVVTESHPKVEMSAEVKDAGVEQGADAKEHELPAEVKEIGAELAKAATPLPDPTQTPPAHITQSYDELVVEAKASKSPKEANSWSLRKMIREWKKKLFAETGEVPK